MLPLVDRTRPRGALSLPSIAAALQRSDVESALLHSSAGVLHACCRRAVGRDRSQWVLEQVEEVAAAVDKGEHAAIWRFARALTGRARRRAVASAQVLRDSEGNIVGDQLSARAEWSQLFLKEFNGLGEVVELPNWVALRDAAPLAAGSSPLSVSQWAERVADVACSLRVGRAPGCDLVPPEAIRACGLGGWAILGQVLFLAASEGIPDGWRGWGHGGRAPEDQVASGPWQCSWHPLRG